ncbi:DUF2218 domain-containing protein [Marinimicrobium sp. C2-29]|uniref:DUF2218 domain-containing protein n=1 Tax=Marinimicrobium sp. C2-29 TaxID=3139825 RepID=UPI0031396F7D
MTTGYYTSSAQVPLSDPGRVLHRLCKHFSHKVKAQWEPAQGFVDFAVGTAILRATPHALCLECEAGSRTELAEVEQTLERHLGPMSGLPDDEIVLVWERPVSE